MFNEDALDIAKPFLEEELSLIQLTMLQLTQKLKKFCSFVGIGVGTALYSNELIEHVMSILE